MKLPKFNKKWKWMAMDKDGTWSVYTRKPIIEDILDFGWDFDSKCESSYVSPIALFKPANDWKKSLIRINK